MIALQQSHNSGDFDQQNVAPVEQQKGTSAPRESRDPHEQLYFYRAIFLPISLLDSTLYHAHRHRLSQSNRILLSGPGVAASPGREMHLLLFPSIVAGFAYSCNCKANGISR